MSNFIKGPSGYRIDPGEHKRDKCNNIHRWVIQERIIGNEFTMVVVYVCYDCGQQKVERI